MIPVLTVDEKYIDTQWKNKDNAEWVKTVCTTIELFDGTPVYKCDDFFVQMKVFNEWKDTERTFFEYGYCDTEDALVKYLKKYKDDPDNPYFVKIGGMDMDYEKYYKNGSYINKDGVDTESDYYDYIDEHPEMEVKQDVEGKWITFNIYKLHK